MTFIKRKRIAAAAAVSSILALGGAGVAYASGPAGASVPAAATPFTHGYIHQQEYNGSLPLPLGSPGANVGQLQLLPAGSYLLTANISAFVPGGDSVACNFTTPNGADPSVFVTVAAAANNTYGNGEVTLASALVAQRPESAAVYCYDDLSAGASLVRVVVTATKVATLSSQ